MPGINARHVSAGTSYSEERIDCSCGVVVTAEPDTYRRDRHEPLMIAWNKHRMDTDEAHAARQARLAGRPIRHETP